LLGAALDAALYDHAVDRIVIEFATEGGVFGIEELARSVRSARGIKPIVGVVNSLSQEEGALTSLAACPARARSITWVPARRTRPSATT